MTFKVWLRLTFSSWNIPAMRIVLVRRARTVCSLRLMKHFTLLSTNQPIYLVGESLGTGVATYLAGTYSNKIAGVILISPFNRLTDVAQRPLSAAARSVIARGSFSFRKISPLLSWQSRNNGWWQRRPRFRKNLVFVFTTAMPVPKSFGNFLTAGHCGIR